MKLNFVAASLFVIGSLAAAAPASAQVTTATGVTFSGSATQNTTEYSINLGSAGVTGPVSNMPMSINYGAVTMNAAFTGNSNIYFGSTSTVASQVGSGNFFNTREGAISLDFSAELKSFSMQWGSPDWNNNLDFYNGSTLLASFNGSQRQSMTGTYSNFSFAEAGFTRVVATGASSSFEFANVTFGDAVVAPDVAPIPLNAASLGGLMSFLMMIFMRGKGGTQVAIRMALASIMPRRRVVA
jgi:hypothetical protein